MLPDPLSKVLGDTYIECPISFACQDIYRWLYIYFCLAVIPAFAGMTAKTGMTAKNVPLLSQRLFPRPSHWDDLYTHLTPRVSLEVRIGKGNLIGLFIADLNHYPSGNALGRNMVF
jgi:hypothetical protein